MIISITLQPLFLDLKYMNEIWFCLSYPINVSSKGMKQQRLLQDVTYRNLAAMFGFPRFALSFFILSCHQIFNIQIDKKENICFSLIFECVYLKFKSFISRKRGNITEYCPIFMLYYILCIIAKQCLLI